MTAEHLKKGEIAEQQAERVITKAGYRIIARNVHSRFGEIDLIGQYQQQLVFFEVRYRSNPKFGSAAESVSVTKQRKIIKAAEFFLAGNPKFQKLHMRFDVIGIDGQDNVQWLEGAFQVS